MDLGTLSGTVELDISPLDKSLSVAVSKVQKWQKDATAAAASAGKGTGEALGSKTTEGVTGQLKKDSGKLSKAGEDASKAIGDGASPGARKAGDSVSSGFLGRLSTLATKAREWGKRAGQEVGDGAEPEAGKAGQKASHAFEGGFAAPGLGKKLIAGLGIAGIAVAAKSAVSNVMSAGWDRLSNIQDAGATLTGLGMSAETSSEVMKNALSSVKGTSFGLGDAATTAAGAVAAGIEPGEKLEAVLKGVANSAAATKSPLNEMGAIWNKAATMGRANNEILQQVADRGLPIYQKLADAIGVPVAEVEDMASKGKISFEMFAQAATAASGTVADEMGGTATGSIKNFKAALGRLGAAGLAGVFDKVAPAVQGATAWIDKAAESITPLAEAWGAKLVSAGEKATTWLTGTAIPAFQSIIDLVFKGDYTGGLADFFGIEEDSPLVDWILSVRDTIMGIPEAVRAAWDLIIGGDYTAEFNAAFGLEEDSPVVGAALKIGEAIRGIPNALREAAEWVAANREWLTPIVVGVVAFVATFKTVATVVATVQALKLAFLALNVVMRANPFGIIISAIAAVAAGLVYAYHHSETFRNFVDGVFGKIKTAAKAVVDWFTGPFADSFKAAWDKITGAVGTARGGIETAINAVAGVFRWLNDNVIQPVWTGIKTAIVIAITAILVAWAGIKWYLENVLAAPFLWLYYNVVAPVWQWIQDKIGAVSGWMTTVAGPAIMGFVGAVVGGFNWARDRISEAWSWIQNNIIDPVVQWFLVNVVARVISFAFQVVAGFNLLRDGVGAAWDWIQNRIVQPVVDWFQNTIVPAFTGFKDSVIGAFEALKCGVETAWNGLKAVAAKPVEFVVNRVMAPLVETYNDVAGVFGVDKVAVPSFSADYWSGGYTGNGPKYAPAGTVHAGEVVWSQDDVAAHGGPQAVDRLRKWRGYAEGGIVMPVDAPVTSGYGYRNGPFNGPELHDGIDYGAPSGTPVRSAAGGMVVFAGQNDGYGNYVEVNSGAFSLFYAHLSSIAAKMGQIVEAGAVLGAVGSTGMSTGPHLHLGAKDGSGRSIDPSTLLGGALPSGGGGFGFDIGGIIEKLTGFLDPLGELADNPFTNVVKGAGKKVVDSAVEWLRSKVSSIFGSGPVTDGNFDGWWSEAISIAGERWAPYKGAVATVAQHESGMNPNAANNWDSNSMAGIPSKGLLQFIEPTFRQYAWPGHNNWLSPVDQILAFFKYVPARYGSIENHPGLRGVAGGSGYVGYANGTPRTGASKGWWRVGESGPEWINFGGHEQVRTDGQTLAGGGKAVHVHLESRGDPRRDAEEAVWVLVGEPLEEALDAMEASV